ncbi:response regulator transcription factor [Cellulomonas citrea]|uniref:response regulator transcription factor n=1 Tax=Cellulomonas citrea TaxID=1909423 RepID=UPI001F3D60AC|nr:response regulator transcription factor [Cellulomonas citrea]
MPHSTVLVVDDESDIRRVVVAYLDQAGYQTLEAGDGTRALELARDRRPDVVVLDLALPDLDGVEVCRRLRTFTDAYVLMLTARAEEVDTLIGLSVGADDYLTKPFSPKVLLARVATLLRRPRTEGAGRRVLGDLVLDPDARLVSVAGVDVDLTRTEFDVLAALTARPGQVLTRAQLVEQVWGGGWVGDERLVDVHVAHLRAKLGPDAGRRYVVTVRGVGFRTGPG